MIRAIRFEKPESIHINIAFWHHYDQNAPQDLMEAHPFLFPAFTRRKTVNPQFGLTRRRDEPYTAPQGCVRRGLPGRLRSLSFAMIWMFLFGGDCMTAQGNQAAALPQYTIRPAFFAAPGGELAWDRAEVLRIESFRQAPGSKYRPETQVRLLYDAEFIYVQFHVKDQYVRAVSERYQDKVSNDSCVEFFVRPKADGPYFNFEINAGGVLLLYCIPVTPDGRALLDQHIPVPEELTSGMNIFHSLPSRIDPEISEPCEWRIEYRIPVGLLEHYVGHLGSLEGQRWQGNFYKCGSATSNPHWGAWASVGQGWFHQPDLFGEIVFGPAEK
jgi:hypothetical protein